MSRVHNVISGDTLTKIAAQYYGDGTKWPQIHSANPTITNPDLIFPGSKVSIPDLPDSPESVNPSAPPKTEVSPESVDDRGNSSEVALSVDGQTFKLWTAKTVNRSFDVMADTFTLASAFTPDNLDGSENETIRKLFKPYGYQEVVLYMGGEKILTGNAIKVSNSNSANQNDVTISGYSKPGILNDVTPSPSSWPLSFDGLNLKQIADRLSNPFGISVKFDGDPGAPFRKDDKVDMEPDEKVAAFLIKLAKIRGFVLGADILGNLIFRTPTTEPATVSIIGGKWPYISSSSSADGQTRFSDITAISTNSKKGAGKKITVSDPGLKDNGINRPTVWKAQDSNAGNLRNVAIQKMGRIIANSFSLTVNVESFHRPDGKLWADNQRVIYQNDDDHIYKETEFLIREAKPNDEPDKEVTDLTLVFPQVYSGEIITEFPWD